MILELSDQDNVALEEISKILERHPDLKLIEMVVEPTLIFNHLIIDTGKRKVYYNQQEVLLTTKEYELLYRLALYEGRVLSYRQLYEAVWGEDPMGNEANAVSCHVYGLRRKFREIAPSLYFSRHLLGFPFVPLEIMPIWSVLPQLMWMP